AVALGIRQWYAVSVIAFGAFVLSTIGLELWRGTRARMGSRQIGPAAALLGLIAKNRRRYGGYIVHIGVVFVFAGVAGALFVSERSVRMRPGDEIEIGPFSVLYRGADVEGGPNYTATVANLTVSDGRTEPRRMRPERRFYPLAQEQVTTEVAIWSRPFEDFYAILESYQPGADAVDVTLLVNPMVLWIWIGGGIMVIGILIALSTRTGSRRQQRDEEPVGAMAAAEEAGR
ncbi:MAG: cytochrome c-type biogenesis CcmF C-terminal domain-containing protein, partial [Gemmatimonadota bacterium]